MTVRMLPAAQAAVEYGALAIQRLAGAVGRQADRLGDFVSEHRILVASIVVVLALFVLRPRSRRRR